MVPLLGSSLPLGRDLSKCLNTCRCNGRTHHILTWKIHMCRTLCCFSFLSSSYVLLKSHLPPVSIHPLSPAGILCDISKGVLSFSSLFVIVVKIVTQKTFVCQAQRQPLFQIRILKSSYQQTQNAAVNFQNSKSAF